MDKIISKQEPESFLLGTASDKVQLEAVKEDGFSIQFIKNPSQEVQLEAVKQDGFSIQYIKKPSQEVQLEAVKQISNSKNS